MIRIAKWTFVLALLAVIASPAMGGEKKKKKKKARTPQAITAMAKSLAKVDLTDEQTTKIAAINAEYAPKLQQAQKDAAAFLGKEMRKKRGEALKSARKAGKKGKELQAAANAAINLSTEQQEQWASAQAASREVSGAYRKEVVALLKPEQREAAGLKGKRRGKKKKAA